MSISAKAIDVLRELGFALTAKPEFDIPMLPRDITELDDEGLMDLFVQYTQWNDHLAGAQAIAIINEREAQRELDKAESAAMLQHWTGAKGGDKITIVKAQIAASELIQELSYDLDTKYAFRKLIETRTLNVERDSQVVSRELTRRTSDGGGFRSRQRKFVS
jgi:hypothetical protein